MKELKKKIALFVCLSLALTGTVAALAGCGGDDDPPGSETYTFAAALTDLDDVEGEGWSGGESGIGMIVKDWEDDDIDWKTISGYYVTYLYVEDTALTFEITSDRDVEDAKLILSLSTEGAEYSTDGSLTLSPDIYTVELNGTAVQYEPIVLYDIPASPGELYEFEQYTVATNLALKQGTNVVRLISSNDISMGGTTRATAPMVDCIQITTSAKLTWSPRTDNLDQFGN